MKLFMQNTSKKLATLWLLTLLLALTGCASLSPNFENPIVEITTLKMLPSNGLQQNFEVGLKVKNPNSVVLPLTGMSYSLSIDGYRVASGVSADLNSIEAYGEAQLVLPVSTSLMNSLRLVKGLMASGNREIGYELNASFDTGITFLPKISVSENGFLPL